MAASKNRYRARLKAADLNTDRPFAMPHWTARLLAGTIRAATKKIVQQIITSGVLTIMSNVALLPF
jgi:hypothetical protein